MEFCRCGCGMPLGFSYMVTIEVWGVGVGGPSALSYMIAMEVWGVGCRRWRTVDVATECPSVSSASLQ
eukprot:scaffold161885_cov20-Tisochrysis_lutea.AAC.1